MGSGVFVALDTPYVNVLVRLESLGPDRYELSDNELSVVGLRSGDSISLGDRVRVVIEDVSVVRRQISVRRLVTSLPRAKRGHGEKRGFRGAHRMSKWVRDGNRSHVPQRHHQERQAVADLDRSGD